MIEVKGVKYYTPREIATQSMIVNTKNKGDYNFVLKLIREGQVKAVRLNEDKKIVYMVVSEAEIAKYNDNRFSV